MILGTMRKRLYAALLKGPAMNARPNRSRQRVDVTELSAFGGDGVGDALAALLGAAGKVEVPATVPAFRKPECPESEWSDEQRRARDARERQDRLLRKLREIATDAQDYYNDHGEQALYLGFPLLSIPPAAGKEMPGGRGGGRILAPVAFVPVSLQVRATSRAGVTITCVGEGADRLVPNPALLAWIEQQTGDEADELFADDAGEDPWRELAEILDFVGKGANLPDLAAAFTAEADLERVPDADGLGAKPALIAGAVLGLFPMTNVGLMRDTKWMEAHEAKLVEPVRGFLGAKVLEEREDEASGDHQVEALEFPGASGIFQDLVTHADPCQADAVRHARECPAVVVHGPPGTGKSQTIVNIIGEHLARGERVLFVCDKRTALDVVKYRLDALGLGDLCGVVHDPQRDRRDLYMGLRGILENLSDGAREADPARELERIGGRLVSLHA